MISGASNKAAQICERVDRCMAPLFKNRADYTMVAAGQCTCLRVGRRVQ